MSKYIPECKTGDIIFIYKNNATGKFIKTIESLIPSYKKIKKQYENNSTKLKLFSHVAISQNDALFLETGMHTGAIHRTIEDILDNEDIETFEVYRHKDLSSSIKNIDFYETLDTKYIDTLYNTEFSHKDERDSFFCSQLVSIILKTEKLLNITPTNLGPSSLYGEIKLAKDDWQEVTTEYIDVLQNPKYKTNKERTLSFAKNIKKLRYIDKTLKKSHTLITDRLDGEKELLEKQKPLSSPKNSLDKHLTPLFYFINKIITVTKESDRKKGKLSPYILELESQREECAALYILSIRSLEDEEILHKYILEKINAWMLVEFSNISAKMKNNEKNNLSQENEVQRLIDEINEIISYMTYVKQVIRSKNLQNYNIKILNKLNTLLDIIATIGKKE